jgi:hypothetical protein
MLIVILLPVLGGLLWLIIGRGRQNPQAVGPVAPDDDPAFLGSIGSISDQDERIRQLEEELAKLDAEEQESAQEKPDQDEQPDADDDPRGSRGHLG